MGGEASEQGQSGRAGDDPAEQGRRDDNVPSGSAIGDTRDGQARSERSSAGADEGGDGGFSGDHARRLPAGCADEANKRQLGPAVGHGHDARVDDRDAGERADHADEQPHDPRAGLVGDSEPIEALTPGTRAASCSAAMGSDPRLGRRPSSRNGSATFCSALNEPTRLNDRSTNATRRRRNTARWR